MSLLISHGQRGSSNHWGMFCSIAAMSASSANNEASSDAQPITWEEIRSTPIDERLDDVREIGRDLKARWLIDEIELSLLLCACRKCSRNVLKVYILHKAAFRLLSKREQGQQYDIERVLNKIDACYPN